MKNGRDFTKVFDPKGRLIAVLSFNNMAPVDQSVAHKVDLRVSPMDDSPTRAFKLLMFGPFSRAHGRMAATTYVRVRSSSCNAY